MSTKKSKSKGPSVYTLLINWIQDGSRSTQIPELVLKDKTIGPNFLLYFFYGSIYSVYIDDLFNNFYVFQLDKIDVFKFIKECVLRSGYRYRYNKTYKSKKIELSKKLKKRFPFLKYDDTNLLAEQIENSEIKDIVYESLGMIKPKRRKSKKEDLEGLNTESSKEVESNVYGEDEENFEEVDDDIWTLDRLLTEFSIQEL